MYGSGSGFEVSDGRSRGQGRGYRVDTVVQDGAHEGTDAVHGAARPLHELEAVACNLGGTCRDAAMAADDLEVLDLGRRIQETREEVARDQIEHADVFRVESGQGQYGRLRDEDMDAGEYKRRARDTTCHWPQEHLRRRRFTTCTIFVTGS